MHQKSPATQKPPSNDAASPAISRPFGVVHPSGDTVLMTQLALEGAPGRALDLGCGTGYVALSLAKAGWEVDAVDISPRALAATREGAAREQVEIRVFHSDWFGSVQERYDLIACNPPMMSGESEQTRLLTATLRWFPAFAYRLHQISQPVFERLREKSLVELVKKAQEHLLPGGRLMLVISPRERQRLLHLVPGLVLLRSDKPENCAPNLDVLTFGFEA